VPDYLDLLRSRRIDATSAASQVSALKREKDAVFISKLWFSSKPAVTMHFKP
jgi:hypothetical protein